jgi:glucose/arabinose dehydrogenase
MKRMLFALSIATLTAAGALSLSAQRAARPACDPDNGGITLPDGLCAQVVADNLGAARHLAVAQNGDVYVAIRNQQNAPGGIVALRDTTGDGKADVQERFDADGGTGLALRDGYLYFAHDRSVVRYRLTPGQLVPSGAPEIIVADLPEQRAHTAKSFAFDSRGGMYVNVGAPSNACQADDRKPKVPGQDPCPLLERHGGIWRFDATRPGQTQAQASRYATGLRQMIALAWNPSADALFLVQHGRDQLNTLWPDLFNEQQNAELPSEELLRIDQGSNHGWPYCYHDWQQSKRVLAPEYGGDGKKTDRCAQYPAPIAAFPGHWAPNDLLFYSGAQLPERYRNGAFIAFHGSWNRAPLPQGGYNVVFVPMAGGKTTGKYEIFADGFAGRSPLMNRDDAVFRPTGLAQGPDGSLYVSDGKKGRIWRIMSRSAGTQ